MNKKNETKAYRYYNCNPKMRWTDDCTVRAISSSTVISCSIACLLSGLACIVDKL